MDWQIKIKRGTPYSDLMKAANVNRHYVGECLGFRKYSYIARLIRHLAMNQFEGKLICQ